MTPRSSAQRRLESNRIAMMGVRSIFDDLDTDLSGTLELNELQVGHLETMHD
eukprot:COSAG05_NODE_4325_length_1567_cov_1.333106_3_plen_52_part_00